MKGGDMDKYFRALIEKAWLVFLLAGLAMLFVGVFGRTPIGDFEGAAEIFRLPLGILGALVIVASFALVAAAQLWPTSAPIPTTATKKALSPPFDPLEYGVQVKKPKKDGEIVHPPLTISGTVKKALPKGYELWMVSIGGPTGAPEYWPHKKVEILSDRTWEFDYDPKFKQGELRRLQLYILGEEGQKLVFSTKYINEQHDKTSTMNPKPGHFPVLRTTSDFFEACPLIRIKLSSAPKA
jgi:hypothetical protein